MLNPSHTSKQNICSAYGKYITELASKNKKVIVLEADLSGSTQSVQFKNMYPDRYIEVGVAEQNMVGMAAGLALAGKIPIVHSFACFISMRACEFVRTSVAYPKLNVKFIATHGGISAGTAGTTHHAIEDLAIMRSIPNMVVIAPGDTSEMQQAVKSALEYQGPVYVRFGASEVEDVYGRSQRFRLGKATQLRKGYDATIITTGHLVYEGVCAADSLFKKLGLKVRVLQIATLKPIDERAILKAAKETKNILTIEEHNLLGGLGGSVCEIVAAKANVRVRRMGIPDSFAKNGSSSYIKQQFGLTVENIARNVLFLLNQAGAGFRTVG